MKTQLCVLVTIPHHAGRKRMHLELKDTVTKLMTGDLKKKLIDGVWSSLGALYNTATGSFKELLFLSNHKQIWLGIHIYFLCCQGLCKNGYYVSREVLKDCYLFTDNFFNIVTKKPTQKPF